MKSDAHRIGNDCLRETFLREAWPHEKTLMRVGRLYLIITICVFRT